MTPLPNALGLASEQIEHLLMTAGRAPSLHNSQPWRFHLTPHTIELHSDPRHTPSIADPEGRERRIACGAALYNLRLALHGHHIRPVVTLLPDRERPELLAVIRHGGTKNPTPEQDRLLRAIPRWATNRRPFSDAVVTGSEQYALSRAAREEGAWLHLVHDTGQRTALRTLLGRAHRLQMADPAFRAELATWSEAAPERRDGVPATAGGSPPEPQDLWVLRDFTAGAGRARIPGNDFEDEPTIAVLISHHTGLSAEVQVGQALQRVLLTATAAGLSASFLSQVVEVAQTREELRHLIGAVQPPQAVLRLGRGWTVPTTPRRDIEDLLMGQTTS